MENSNNNHSVIDVHTLPRWVNEEHGYNSSSPQKGLKFPACYNLNKRIILWNGPIWKLKIDAIVNSTNESLSDMSGVSKYIFEAAGPELAIECKASETCRTGEATSTRGCELEAKYVLYIYIYINVISLYNSSVL